MTYTLRVREKFSPRPSGRIPVHGPDNGQRFREEVLRDVMRKYAVVVIDFDGIEIVGASFLDEAIAGLIYHDGFTEAQLKRQLLLNIPSDPTKVQTAWSWVHDAETRRVEGADPRISA